MDDKVFEKRMNKIFNVYDHVISERKKYDDIISGYEDSIEELNDERKKIESTWEVLRSLLDKYSTQNINLLKDLLNKGVDSIFHDRDYSVELDISDTKMKKAKMFLIENVEGNIIRSNVQGGIGGGVRVVISFIFRMFLIKVYGKRRFVLLDEAFTDLSSSYIPTFLEFMKYLVSEMGFDFLWVTQDERIKPYGDKVYEANMGRFRLISNEQYKYNNN